MHDRAIASFADPPHHFPHPPLANSELLGRRSLR